MLKRSGVRVQLYEATRDIHQQLHSAAYIQRLLRKQTDLVDYKIFLTEFAALFSGGLAVLKQKFLPDEITQFAPHQEVVCLTADLLYWQLPLPAPMHFNIKTAQQALGVAYVLHGAHFGISVLARSIDEFVKNLESAGKNFIDYVAQQEGMQWTMLCDYLEHHLVTEQQINEAIAGALQVFAQCQIRLGR